MTDCPFCDFKAGFSQELAYHLGMRHSGFGQPIGSWLSPAVKCWCDQGPFGILCNHSDALSQFAVHLQRHAGATAHWLEHCLGLTHADH
jgi:hypothetical protein